MRADEPGPSPAGSVVRLLAWDRPQLCTLHVETGRIEWSPGRAGDQETHGFAKRFLVGAPLLVYSRNGRWYLQQPGHAPIDLAAPDLRLTMRSTRWYHVYDVSSGDRSSVRFETRLGERFATWADPAYDGIDAEGDDYGGWLMERVAEARASYAGASAS